jgi:hypothetical protein
MAIQVNQVLLVLIMDSVGAVEQVLTQLLEMAGVQVLVVMAQMELLV